MIVCVCVTQRETLFGLPLLDHLWHSHKVRVLLPLGKSPERTDIFTGHWSCQTKGLMWLYAPLFLGVTRNWGSHSPWYKKAPYSENALYSLPHIVSNLRTKCVCPVNDILLCQPLHIPDRWNKSGLTSLQLPACFVNTHPKVFYSFYPLPPFSSSSSAFSTALYLWIISFSLVSPRCLHPLPHSLSAHSCALAPPPSGGAAAVEVGVLGLLWLERR